MCTIFFALHEHPDFPLIVVANRDEFYQRRTAEAQDWGSTLGGRDLKSGGQWMAVDKQGRFAALTNYRGKLEVSGEPVTRGQLVSQFLEGQLDPESYLDQVDAEADRYEGFNLLIGDKNGLWHYSNVSRKRTLCESGVHGLSNHLLDSPWPKVQTGKQQLAALLERGEVCADEYYPILMNRQQYPDEQLPQTGVPLMMERMLSACFIASPAYGTRSATVITWDKAGAIEFHEKRFGIMGRHLGESQFSLSI